MALFERHKLLTPAEARAILDIIDLGWADYDAAFDRDRSERGWGKRWLELARKADAKIRARAAKGKKP